MMKMSKCVNIISFFLWSSSRRLQVSRFELLLQVGAFCLAVGALVTGIFGMNLRSYLEEHVVISSSPCI
ncbi:putative magnesium transporter MRS2 [Helianthus annuus]|nr:putative magnesium transporter MRS2 [Helianthus annuus]KAJ0787321.1 putative magnesium transporter MRS2 [Helianthus annuus]